MSRSWSLVKASRSALRLRSHTIAVIRPVRVRDFAHHGEVDDELLRHDGEMLKIIAVISQQSVVNLAVMCSERSPWFPLLVGISR